MKLDSRIIEGKKPLDCFDAENKELMKSFLNKEGYVSNNLENFCLLDGCFKRLLNNVFKKVKDCFKTSINGGDGGDWKYFLPAEWVKEPEKKYRPYTIKDFEKAFLNDEFDDFIIFRDKHNPDDIYNMRYNGNFRKGQFEYICLGAKNFSFESLFENYEVADYDGDWQPFGVIDE